jgi:hypothetical protein
MCGVLWWCIVWFIVVYCGVLWCIVCCMLLGMILALGLLNGVFLFCEPGTYKALWT